MKENMIYTQGVIDENGSIYIAGIYLEEGATVDLAIKVVPGKFEVAMFPSEEDKECNDICDGDCENCPFQDKGIENERT